VLQLCVIARRPRRRAGFRTRSAAERDQVGEPTKGEKVRLVEWAHTRLAELAVNAERLAAEADLLAKLARQAVTNDHISLADGCRMAVREPAEDRKILCRVEGNDIRGLPVD